jgi:sugar O-acyltransferase (sialic acid O-acetyltransferase NeuD family)
VNYSDPVYVIGAGGQAKVVISTLQALNRPIAGVLSDHPSMQGEHVLGERILGPTTELDRLSDACAVVAIGNNRVRRTFANRYPTLRWDTFVHPRAWVHHSVCLGPGTVVFAGAVVQPDAVIGTHCIVNTGATVDHDCRLADYVHVAPGAHLAGNVHLGEGVLVGMGSSVIQQTAVGAWALIGAGAVVVRDIPEMVIAKGVPARWEKRLLALGTSKYDREYEYLQGQ